MQKQYIIPKTESEAGETQSPVALGSRLMENKMIDAPNVGNFVPDRQINDVVHY